MKDLIKLSGELLLAVKSEKESSDIEQAISGIDIKILINKLDTDNKRKTFWINIYNAYFLILRQRGIAKPDIYKKKYFVLDNGVLSLDDIEHGILRRYRVKLALGYLPNLFASKVIKSLAVEKLDWRIHFALNCGAKSCPPIAYYKLDSIHDQLELATNSYLESDTIIDKENQSLHITQLFKWYNGDFGGQKGIKIILSKYLGSEYNEYTLGYSDYSWEEDLQNFNF